MLLTWKTVFFASMILSLSVAAQASWRVCINKEQGIFVALDEAKESNKLLVGKLGWFNKRTVEFTDTIVSRAFRVTPGLDGYEFQEQVYSTARGPSLHVVETCDDFPAVGECESAYVIYREPSGQETDLFPCNFCKNWDCKDH